MKKYKTSALIYYIASALLSITATIWFVSGNAGLGGAFLCLGSMNLCLGTVMISNYRRTMNLEGQQTEKTKKEANTEEQKDN